MGERRRHERAEVDGYVVVHAPVGAIHGRILNLSVGGILVRESDDAQPIDRGTQVLLELELEGLGWATQAGSIVRASDGELAIEFDVVAPLLHEVIACEVGAATQAKTNPRVVVVDPSPGRRRRITEALREAGARSLEASTPLEAVDLIERSRVRVSAIAVADSMSSQTQSDELVDWIEETHPGLQVALITDRPTNPRHATLPGDEHADLRGPVRDLLARRPSST
jgi:CheY-like chemotaxis protein